MLLSAAGSVDYITPRARQLLRAYFPRRGRRTIAKHVERIHRKLGVDNRAAAATRAHDVAAAGDRDR